MVIALWIIAVCEVIRAAQNGIQLWSIAQARKNDFMKTATDEFVKSLNRTDKEFVEDILTKFKESDNEG